MAIINKHQSLDEQIEQRQKDSWIIADLCDSEQMTNRDRIFEKGLVMEEVDLMKKIFEDNLDKDKEEYIVVLNLMKQFYNKIAKQQGVLI
ncbi:hypothetical protein [Cytobacillus gottheilii]|uniref:hypothetical protein n=1 Tax=Cytobacillus gottheilii TaxID=859144 RepID=UPI00082B9F90|nr:hypothetical protein [Cytobacillus gottheilii]